MGVQASWSRCGAKHPRVGGPTPKKIFFKIFKDYSGNSGKTQGNLKIRRKTGYFLEMEVKLEYFGL